MDNYFEQVPDNIKNHLKEITKTSGLPDNEDSYQLMAKVWLDKKKMFEAQIKSLDMIEIENFNQNDSRRAILITFSGSLISLGVNSNETKWAEYYSLSIRHNVPDVVKISETKLTHDININQNIDFETGPIKSTSSILKIAVCKEDVTAEEQERRIHEAIIFLTNGFVKLNRTLTIDATMPDQFRMTSIVKHIAQRNNLTIKQVKAILEDYLTIIESGMLLGDRIKVGRIGKLYLRKRPAQKAKLSRNPKTGEQIMVPAKPEKNVPKFSFSKVIKDKAIRVDTN